MSYAIIRNQKYKRENLKGIFRHNERKNENYSNKNIDKEKSYLNYSLKDPKYSYEKDFERIRKEYNLKGQIKTVSNIACEYIITSDNEFFNKIGEKETRRFFETAYKFVCEYKNLGEQYILSAKVHNDEDTPHMHLVFLPVVHTKDKKGNDIDKLACSEFWKEKDSYRRLQNAFYEYIILHNFELERGLPKEETNRTHLSIEEYKKITNYEKTKEILQDITLELPEVPSIEDFNKVVFKRNEKIQKEIIEPKDKLIEKLYSENKQLHREIERQVNVIDEAEKYQKETFSEYKVAYLHGKMKPKEKDEIMERFKNGEIQILIATTVIEVGVNVPNSSIMVVENAERFGLAQLHQLRGRVGRGEYQSYCILKYEGNSETIKQRMKVMCDTNDGFIISEKDLELRGSGDFFGTEQHGLPEFKIANLFEDIAVLKKVQRLALKIMEDDPLLEKEKNAKLNNLVKEKFSSRIEI